MPYAHPEIVDKIHAIRDLVMVIAESLDKGKTIDPLEGTRMSFVLVHFACEGLDEVDELMKERE